MANFPLIAFKRRKIILFAAFAAVMFVFLPGKASSAILSLRPASGNFTVGSNFDLSIVLDTKKIPINLVEAEIFFPQDKMQLTNPSVGQSIIQIWPAPPVFSNQQGRIYFAGGIPSPGINTSDSVVLTFSFRVTTPGQAVVKFGEKTSVLANDGKGTNVLNQTSSAFLNFSFPPPQGPKIYSPSHPDQEKWYKDNNPIFNWEKIGANQAYSYILDNDPSGSPDTTEEGDDSTVSYQNLESGIWYFHLREKSNGIWGGVSHYAVKIDNQPPASFGINIFPSKRTTNKNPVFRFFTTDALSGFDHFEMKIISLSADQASEALFFQVDSPYQAVNLQEGRYQIIIRAVDKAGNQRDESAIMNIVGSLTKFFNPEGIDLNFVFLPWKWILFGAGFLCLSVLVIFLKVWFLHRRHIKRAMQNIGQKTTDYYFKKS